MPPQGRADRKAGNTCTRARLAPDGRGHRPCPGARLILARPRRALASRGARTCRSPGHRRTGAKGQPPLPWQRPSPLPQRKAHHTTAGQRPPRPRRALASVSPGRAGLRGTVPRGRGKRWAFPFPARRGERPAPAAMAKAIAFATVQDCPSFHLRPKAPCQRPPGGAPASVRPGAADLPGTVPHRRLAGAVGCQDAAPRPAIGATVSRPPGCGRLPDHRGCLPQQPRPRPAAAS